MCDVVLEESGRIPAWVVDHASFRRWAYSTEFPERGRFGFLNGAVWVDLSMERDSHNNLKTEIATVVASLVKGKQLGRYYTDGMMITNVVAGLSTEPDGMFVAWDTLKTGKVRLEGGPRSDGIELVGAPDMVLEVVSPSLVTKDTTELKKTYYRAGIPEYWLVDNRGAEIRFDILRHRDRGYRAARPIDGWQRSAVFGAVFRLRRGPVRMDHQTFVFESR